MAQKPIFTRYAYLGGPITQKCYEKDESSDDFDGNYFMSEYRAMPGLVIKPRSRIFHGHDWVYASEVQKAFGNPQPGDVVSLKDFKDRPLGTAIYNPASQIVARRISRRKQELDAEEETVPKRFAMLPRYREQRHHRRS